MKKLTHLFCTLALVWACAVSALAVNQVTAIEIDAVLYRDGSMYVTQTWDTSFDEGTESYIPMTVPDYVTIGNLRVADQSGVYQTLERWNVDADFEEKAGKCGINYTSDGYEICFGISQYGQNRYAIEYKLENVVGAYTDVDGVNFRFVNEGMNTTPTDVNLNIRLYDGTPIVDETCDIWAFGYEGEVGFENGAIHAFTQSPINQSDDVTVMFAFQKGVLSPVRTENTSFETVKQRAFDGSDYDDTEEEGSFVFGFIAMMIIVGVPVLIVTLVATIRKKRRKKQLERFAEEFGYCRDAPNSGNIYASYALGRLFSVCEDGAILATGMLHLMEIGCLVPLSEETVGFMGSTKEVVNLQMTGSKPEKMNAFDEYLYTVLESAAGADGILQAKELEKFSDGHDQLLRTYISKCDEVGRQYLRANHCIIKWQTPSRLQYLTESGTKELGELLGFKRYLTDFSLIAERGLKELPIWQELLTYAMLFGIAEQVAQQMKELYPELTMATQQYQSNVLTAYSYCHVMTVNMRQAEQRRIQAQRSSGSGGFSSRGGGGGSMGGGRGGGTR